jgi:hypothetical protein
MFCRQLESRFKLNCHMAAPHTSNQLCKTIIQILIWQMFQKVPIFCWINSVSRATAQGRCFCRTSNGEPDCATSFEHRAHKCAPSCFHIQVFKTLNTGDLKTLKVCHFKHSNSLRFHNFKTNLPSMESVQVLQHLHVSHSFPLWFLY